jgi:hypothetical protein
MSATQSWFGRSAWKFRSTRSQAGRTRSSRKVAEGCAGAFASADASQAGSFHQSLDPLTADTDALVDQLRMDTWRAIGLSRGPVDRPDTIRQIRIST